MTSCGLQDCYITAQKAYGLSLHKLEKFKNSQYQIKSDLDLNKLLYPM
jgi:hypothetical protein